MLARDLRRLVIATAMLAVTMAAAATGQTAWQTVTGPDGSFTVEMPGVPEYFPSESTTAQGTSYTVHQYILDRSGMIYGAQFTAYSKDVDLSDPKAVLQIILDG